MSDIKEVIQTMLNELNALTVPQSELSSFESELLILHMKHENLKKELSVAIDLTKRHIIQRNIDSVLLEISECMSRNQHNPAGFPSVIAQIVVKENQIYTFKTRLAEIFKAAVLTVDSDEFAKLKGRVSLYIHPDKLESQATRENAQLFFIQLNTASQVIKDIPITTYNTAHESKELFKKIEEGGLQATRVELAAMLDKFKRYPEAATAEEIAEIDANNLKVLVYIRDCINSPLLNTAIDVGYQYYRYPEFIKNALYYVSAVINSLLVLGVALASLALFLALVITSLLQSLLESLYLNQFNEVIKRKGYIYSGKLIQEKNGGEIDDSGNSDDGYAMDGKAYLIGQLRDEVAEQKMTTCFNKPFVIEKKGYIAIYKTTLNPEDRDDSGASDQLYATQGKAYLTFLLRRNFSLKDDVIHLTKEDYIKCGRALNQDVRTDDLAREEGLEHFKKILKPAVAAQLTDEDFEASIVLTCNINTHNVGLTHYNYVFSSIFEDLTKPLPPEDRMLKTMFLRILRLSIALPAALLISFPLSLAQELCERLITALGYVAVGVKLLSAFVFATPLYVYDALAWAVRCCSCQPAPEVDKDRFFKHLANSIFRTSQSLIPITAEEASVKPASCS